MIENKKKRKGYSTLEQQYAANKRYLENNPDAKEKIRLSMYKSQAKRFIKSLGNKKELLELKEILDERLKDM